MNLFQFSNFQFQTFVLIFFRIGGILFAAPIFGNRNVPHLTRVGLILIVSLILTSTVRIVQPGSTLEILPLGIALISELLIGIVIGFTVNLIFSSVQLSGQLVGFQMGFAIVNVMDPLSSNQISIIAQFQNILAILIFLAIDAHHWFLRAAAESFELIPPIGFYFSNELFSEIIRISGNMFIISVKIGAPLMAVLLFTSMSLGVIARTVPQMNVFIAGFPVKIAIGLLFLGFSLPLFAQLLKGLFDGLGNEIYLLMRLMTRVI